MIKVILLAAFIALSQAVPRVQDGLGRQLGSLFGDSAGKWPAFGPSRYSTEDRGGRPQARSAEEDKADIDTNPAGEEPKPQTVKFIQVAPVKYNVRHSPTFFYYAGVPSGQDDQGPVQLRVSFGQKVKKVGRSRVSSTSGEGPSSSGPTFYSEGWPAAEKPESTDEETDGPVDEEEAVAGIVRKIPLFVDQWASVRAKEDKPQTADVGITRKIPMYVEQWGSSGDKKAPVVDIGTPLYTGNWAVGQDQKTGVQTSSLLSSGWPTVDAIKKIGTVKGPLHYVPGWSQAISGVQYAAPDVNQQPNKNFGFGVAHPVAVSSVEQVPNYSVGSWPQQPVRKVDKVVQEVPVHQIVSHYSPLISGWPSVQVQSDAKEAVATPHQIGRYASQWPVAQHAKSLEVKKDFPVAHYSGGWPVVSGHEQRAIVQKAIPVPQVSPIQYTTVWPADQGSPVKKIDSQGFQRPVVYSPGWPSASWAHTSGWPVMSAAQPVGQAKHSPVVHYSANWGHWGTQLKPAAVSSWSSSVRSW